MNMSRGLIVTFVLSVLVTGCGKPKSTALDVPKPPPTPSTAASAANSGADGAPPPAPDASAPGSVGTVAASSGDDVAFYRTRNAETGQLASDLEVINDALMAYGTDGKQRPPFKDLQDLVTQGLLKKLPTPPEGKKFAFDPKTAKATLVNR